MPPPSEFGKKWNEIIPTIPENQKMNCHRPPEYYDTHISLFYNSFDDFLAKRNSLDIGQDDDNNHMWFDE